MKDKVIIISGATATGKTKLSIKIVQNFPSFNFGVVNFDSLLFYKELNIGTAKPSQEELELVEHHLVSIESISNEINASSFVEKASLKIEEIISERKIPVLVGGSTFYLRALIKGMYNSPTTSLEIKKEVENILKTEGSNYFSNYLKIHDFESYESIHENDFYRIQRAYEHYQMTGKKISEEKINSKKNGAYNFSENIRVNWDILHLNLNLEKEVHWKIMHERVQRMLEEGLVDEVSNLLANGFTGKEKALQSIGYKETLSYLQGEIKTKEELIEKIYFSTRRLAKSQKNFLKKIEPKETLSILDRECKVLVLLEKFLSN